jgi:hypothetical protein
MKLALSVKLGAWILIGLNLLMSFASIWIFMRMAPVIEIIIVQNDASLEACEEMLAALSLGGGLKSDTSRQIESFRRALDRAKNNITEKEESNIITKITQGYEYAFNGDPTELNKTVKAIIELGDVNRVAMRRANGKARQLGYAGAWGVVFMAIIIFLVEMIFLRSLKSNLSDPLQEIDSAVSAFRNGDTMRRCSLRSPPKTIKQVFTNVNELLDICSIQKPGDQHQKEKSD